MLSPSNLLSAKLVLLSLALLLLLSHVMSQRTDTELFHRQTRKRFCGRHLTEVLNFLCVNSPPSKKSDEYDLAYADQPSFSIDPEFSPFLNKLAAAALVPNYNRGRPRRGITDECCYKSCTMDELRSYCGPGGYNGLK